MATMAALVAVLLLLHAATIHAVPVTWKGVTANWEDPVNWIPSYPTGTDDVSLQCAQPNTNVTLSSTISIGSLTTTGCMLDLQPGASLSVTRDFNCANYVVSMAPETSFTANQITLQTACRLDIANARITSRAPFKLFGDVNTSGNTTITAQGGLEWKGTVSMGAGTSGARSCLSSSVLTIVGNVVGLVLVTYLDIAPIVYGKVIITGSLGGTSDVTAYLMSPRNQVPYGLQADFVTAGELVALTPHFHLVTIGSYKFCPARESTGLHGGSTKPEIVPDCTPNGLAVIFGPCSKPQGGGDTICPPGYTRLTNGTCTLTCPNQCNLRGTCELNSLQTSAACICNPGYSGFDCSVPSCASLNNCYGVHGQCVATAGAPQCVCAPGWTGADCSVGMCYCNENQYCETAGAIVTPTCKCKAGWSGPTCAEQEAPLAGTQPCPSNCNGNHGDCLANGQCRCNSLWTGQDCSVPQCPNNCNFQGTCSAATHTCNCSTGWTGGDCSTAICVACVHGACATTATPPECVCEPGWYGLSCNEQSLSASRDSTPTALSARGKMALIAAGTSVALIGLLVAAVFLLKNRLPWLTRTTADDTVYMLQ